MAYSQALRYEEMQTFDTSSLTGSYQPLGIPLPQAASIVKIVNNGSSVVTISTDGIKDHDVIPGLSFALYDCTTNAAHASAGAFLSKNTQFFVKGSMSSGFIYLVTLYLRQG